MIYKNAELHNVEKIINNDDGSISWLRVTQNIYDAFECEQSKNMAIGATGVELRFKMKSDQVVLKMSSKDGNGAFQIYRGAIQGGWYDCAKVYEAPGEYVIKRSQAANQLKTMTEQSGSEWNCDVIRVIFDWGRYKLYDIIGDIEPPTEEDYPSKKLLCYGSSITHGSNAMDMSHSWVSMLAHNLGYDVRNKGMAGSCFMEPEFVDYIAAEGKNGRWDALTLELGINVTGWEESKMREHAEYTVKTIAEANLSKPIFVISPFYHYGEYLNPDDGARTWRRVLSEVVEKYKYANVTYINGLDILGDMTLLSGDFIHPSIYGVAQIAERLTDIIKPIVRKYEK